MKTGALTAAMDKSYEEIYAVVEERHPWFLARRRLFASLAGDDPGARILDVGCGTGIFLIHLRNLGFEHLAGVETSAELRARSRDPSIETFAELPDRRGYGFLFDKIFMLDVLEHIDDDRGTLERIHGLLAAGGRFYLSVPAHPFLWSRHDEINQHRRRYRKGELGEKLRAAGFRIRKLSYWNSLAFPAIWLARRLRLGESKPSDFHVGNPAAWWLYGLVLRFENWWVRHLPLPIGVSLIAVAEKADA